MSTTSRIAQPYRSHHARGIYDAVVIGSGIGGLGAAALLARYGGKRVLVLERHYTPGGYTHVFRRPGYEWDVGVHYVGEVGPGQMLAAVFGAITDGSLKWNSLGEVYDRIVLGNSIYELRAGANNLRRDLKASFPNEAAAIDRYFALVAEVVSSSRNYFMAKALPATIAAVAGPLLRRSFMRLAERTTRSVLEDLTRDQKLIAVLTGQWGDFGLPPAESSFAIHAMVANHYFEGAYYPVGGASRIAAAVSPVIKAAGGNILINGDVTEIAIENGRAVGVKMADGAVIRAPIILSDAGVMNTMARLLPPDVAQRRRVMPNPRALRPSIAHLCLYIGLRETAEQLGLPKGNLWVYPDERHEQTFANALGDGDGPMPPVFISFPSAKDPDFSRRHPGRATIDVITLARWETFAQWADTRWKKRPGDYEALKDKLTRRLLEVVCRHVPQIEGKIDICELSTPVTTQHFANYGRGEIYGLAHTPARFSDASLQPRTAIPGLFLTGQDVSSCGVAGALMGGVLCASAVLQRNLMSRIVRDSQTEAPPAAGARAIA
jgi:phytoene dehydrogenase-like protein